MTQMELIDLIIMKASQYKLEPNLVKAIIKTESNFDQYAMRYEPDWTYLYRVEWTANYLKITPDTEKQLQKFSWSYMQIMGSVARELGFSESLMKLCDPQINIELGCIKLRKLFDKYKEESAVISAYNSGTPRKDAWGAYINKAYVFKVQTNKLKFMGE